jgi:Ni/Co efflux regulator RcnB
VDCGEEEMKRYITALTLAAALLAPIAGRAEDNRSNSNQRYYDSRHGDWHQWNDNEDRAYRQYLQEHHRSYRDFNKASKRDRNAYFSWRHDHGDTAEKR